MPEYFQFNTPSITKLWQVSPVWPSTYTKLNHHRWRFGQSLKVDREPDIATLNLSGFRGGLNYTRLLFIHTTRKLLHIETTTHGLPRAGPSGLNALINFKMGQGPVLTMNVIKSRLRRVSVPPQISHKI